MAVTSLDRRAFSVLRPTTRCGASAAATVAARRRPAATSGVGIRGTAHGCVHGLQSRGAAKGGAYGGPARRRRRDARSEITFEYSRNRMPNPRGHPTSNRIGRSSDLLPFRSLPDPRGGSVAGLRNVAEFSQQRDCPGFAPGSLFTPPLVERAENRNLRAKITENREKRPMRAVFCLGAAVCAPETVEADLSART